VSALTVLAERAKAAVVRDEEVILGEAWELVGPNLPRTAVADTAAKFACFLDVGAFLEAAVLLVPTKPFPELRPGEWWWMVDSLGCAAHVAYENHDSGIPEYSATCASPALALCAAALAAWGDM
jgi:hypothetical protein